MTKIKVYIKNWLYFYLVVRRFIAILFLILYFSASSGATLQLHYCTDRLAGWTISFTEKEKWAKCGMAEEERNGCCHDESKLIKVDKDHKASHPNISFNRLVFQISASVPTTTEFYKDLRPAIVKFYDDAPPPDLSTSIYLLNSVFRI